MAFLDTVCGIALSICSPFPTYKMQLNATFFATLVDKAVVDCPLLPFPSPFKTCNVDRYSVLTGEWTQLDVSQATDCFSDHSGVANDDGTIYLFGGYDQDYVAQTTVVKVEVSSDDTMTFSTAEAMPIVSVAVVEGGGGGYDTPPSAYSPTRVRFLLRVRPFEPAPSCCPAPLLPKPHTRIQYVLKKIP